MSEKERIDWYSISKKLHRLYEGKIEVIPKVPAFRQDDFAIWYTPGVAGPAKEDAEDPDATFHNTWRWNTVAVVSDGTRVLGLGAIGPEGALPVMEGKALLFKALGGVDAVPLVHRARDREKFLELLVLIEPSFGGINLEDIESPKCFYLLDEARKRLNIPIWHDDQQGTATVTLAGLINAAKLTGRDLRKMRIALIGAGAANTALYRLLKAYGVDPKNMVVVDSKGVLHSQREDIEKLKEKNPWKYQIAVETDGGWNQLRGGGIKEALEGAEAVVAASKPGPGVIKPEWIKLMDKDPIVFAEANPVPEIWPWEAKEAGARVVATGRSDFPNQVNNSLAFPSIFRGVLDVRARTITDTMAIAAAEELARFAEEKGLREDYIIPSMEEWEVYPRVAAATAVRAVEEGVARLKTTYEEEYEKAKQIIATSREKVLKLVDVGLIKKLPEEVEAVIQRARRQREEMLKAR
ncbi:NAD(P)-dependent malic enzyme [Hyperthermus butylicus]|uniref:Malic enzyme n=1 Tax=Hyperthermus butylicus (strain DSM 5456 / JCM 9403 / PLM1-5) TaxID=415426 RepID=A2BJ64_HYPBU|nr:NADP-dependent malic enzyme [Hyperthermus butylicus]ABM80025.1 Malic enzyme [Hyperthermus butylicus DSM 5456]